MKKIKIDRVEIIYYCDDKPTGGYKCLFNECIIKDNIREDIEHNFVNAIEDNNTKNKS